MRLSQLTGKRTNSLGWAKSDCHTCSSHGRHCDRRRPRCTPCLEDGGVCAGYVQQLNWDRGSLKILKRRSRESTNISEAAVEPATFTFVDQTEKGKPPRRRSRTNSRTSDKSFSRQTTSPVDVVVTGPVYAEDTTLSISPSSSWSLSSPETPRLALSATDAEPFLYPPIARNPGDVEYSLGLFHSCFAYTTLTFPVNVNPWRACLPAIHEDLPLVRYAAVALAQRQQAHFQGKPEGVAILRLKAKALSLFASQLEGLSFECALSTALLLIALDYAETGVSNWTIHLQGAYRILETHGGIRLAESRPNLRAQIAMLLWYDVNAALISRYGPVFPRTYLEALMAWQADDEWSILALNGLPDDMFLDMQELAVAAGNPDGFDPVVVENIRMKILKTEIMPTGDQHQYSMSQVWRMGLLLYCTRVFPPSSPSMLPDDELLDGLDNFQDAVETRLDPHVLGVEILKTVSEIPAHSNFQKQCLMPVVLAGCEMSAADVKWRKVALEYSERWKQKTGIWIFDSGLEFMQLVWAKNDQGLSDRADDGSESGDQAVWCPWTEIFQPCAGRGFLFG